MPTLKPKLKKIVIALALLSTSLTALADANTMPSITTPTPEFVYKYLLGEVAGQRGDVTLASQLFLDLAKQTRDARLAERAARSAAFANQPAIALQAATLWAELDPSSVEAQQASSQMLVASGNLKQAKPHIEKLLAKEDTRANGFLYLPSLLANQKDKVEVLNAVTEFAKPYPKLPEAHFAVAQAAWAADKPEVAKKSLEAANKLRPGWEVAAQMQGQMLLKESPEKSIAFYKDFLNKHPKANDVRMAYAKLLVSQKKFNEAKPEFVKLVETANGSPEISAVVGILSLESNDYLMADKYFQQSISSGFKNPDQLHLYLGRSAERQKDDAKAITWYDKIQQGENYLDGRLSAASVIARTKNVDTAIKMLDEINDLTPEQQMLVIQTEASMLNSAKREQEAFDMLQKATQNWPNAVEIIYDFAMAAERVGKLDVMETELRKAMKLKPDFAAAYNALGYSFADRNIKLQEAKNLIETALTLQPDDHYMLDSLGWVHYRLGNLDKAAENLRKAYEVQADPEIAAHLGEVLWKQGKQEEAKKIWASALKEHPENATLVATAKKFQS
jgi:tetratricopeptide (TPR) repeat protein